MIGLRGRPGDRPVLRVTPRDGLEEAERSDGETLSERHLCEAR
jgi:hypothetical protein